MTNRSLPGHPLWCSAECDRPCGCSGRCPLVCATTTSIEGSTSRNLISAALTTHLLIDSSCNCFNSCHHYLSVHTRCNLPPQAILKDVGAEKSLSVSVEAESLLNDGESTLCPFPPTFSHFKDCRHDRSCLTQALPWLCFYASRNRSTMTITWPQVEADALRQIATHFDMPITNKTYTLQAMW